VGVAQPHGRFERGVVVIIKDEKGIRTRGNLVLQKNVFQGERIVRAVKLGGGKGHLQQLYSLKLSYDGREDPEVRYLNSIVIGN